jgi:hypothetical protein
MNFKTLLVSSTVLLLAAPAFAAETPAETGIQNYGSVKSAAAKPAAAVSGKAGASAKGKLQIPPPPRETLPGNAALPAPGTRGARPETVKTTLEAASVTVGGATYTCKNEQVQRFADYLELKPDMQNAPLTLHLKNSGMKWFRLLIAGQVIATEKSLRGKSEGDLDLTGVVQPGSNQLLVQAGGAPGATLEWKVTTPAVAKIDKVDPDEALVGTNIKIKGKNFSANMSADTVLLNKTKGQVIKAKPTELEVKIPTEAEPGDTKVSVKVNGVESNKVTIKVRGIPELSGTNLQGVPPGQQLTIFGKNFSKNLGENQVFIGDAAASVVGGDINQLTVIVPYLPYTEGHVPSQIRVQVGKVMSKNSVSVQVGPQMYTDPGVETGKDIPVFNPRDLPRSY